MADNLGQKRMMKSGVLLMIFFISFSSIGIAQEKISKDEKKIRKCWKVFNSPGFDSYDKGIAKLRKYMGKQEDPSLLAYESLVTMEYRSYMRNTSIFEDNIEISVEDEEVDSSGINVLDILKNYYFESFMEVCRVSTIESTSPTADIYLRRFLVDYDPDSLVSEKAEAYYNEAEEFFGKKDYELAELNYRKALKEDDTYYRAALYLGDSFWARESYDSALVYYTQASQIEPDLLEARIFLIDALIEKGLIYRAKKECLDAMFIYPGHNLKYKFQRILFIENKFMNERRFIRYFFPNDMSNIDQGELRDPVWHDYRLAKEEIGQYCSDDGIIEENGETDDRYLEVYSMRRMLEEHEEDLPEYLHFACKMEEEGFLEPYVFISLFHVDIYPQFKDYMSQEENRNKAKDFIEKYLIEAVQ